MTEQELLDMFIQERIDMLLTKLMKQKLRNHQKNIAVCYKQSVFIDNLPKENRKLIQEYIERSYIKKSVI